LLVELETAHQKHKASIQGPVKQVIRNFGWFEQRITIWSHEMLRKSHVLNRELVTIFGLEPSTIGPEIL
jgi:hypothetical protein